MHRFNYSTFSRWARPLLGYLAIVLAMTLFGSTLVRPTSVAKAQDAVKDDQQQAAPEAPSATFPGTGVGALPDGLSGTPPQFGTPLVINFAVTGATGAISSMSANFTMTHSWVGDVDVVLRSPGGTASHTLVSRIGVTTAGSFGSSSDYSGLYTFDDTAAGTNIWTAAAATPVPVGTYRTTAPGQTGQTNPAPVTTMLTAFSALTPAQINGTWTMTFRDAAAADTGSVSAANLTLNFAGPQNCTTAKRPADYDGDGKTDPVVVRNTGGGANGQVTWFSRNSGNGTNVSTPWGISSDYFVSGDYDGDGKQDIAVWRPSNGTWYILRSGTSTLLGVQFGISTDDPTVTGDYDGDGKTDPAVYRSGLAAGQKSFWYWLGSADGLQHGTEWGQNGDFPAPGDYDGDNKNDFVVQRGIGGAGTFLMLRTTAGIANVVFGTPTDLVLPGYYDSDCKTDIGLARQVSGSYNWYILNSTDSSTNTYTFGSTSSDIVLQGDWDGDGKTDIGVWRPNADPAQNFFYWVKSTTLTLDAIEWGAAGDYPVANYNQH